MTLEHIDDIPLLVQLRRNLGSENALLHTRVYFCLEQTPELQRLNSHLLQAADEEKRVSFLVEFLRTWNLSPVQKHDGEDYRELLDLLGEANEDIIGHPLMFVMTADRSIFAAYHRVPAFVEHREVKCGTPGLLFMVRGGKSAVMMYADTVATELRYVFTEQKNGSLVGLRLREVPAGS